MEKEQQQPYDHKVPVKGEGAEELEEFINVESPLDEYLRVKRDMEMEIMSIKEEIEESLTKIKNTLEWIDYAFMRVDMAYKKQIDGDNEESIVH